jgi:UDP:flavonoid glycosyltransferase YjiC (YdhE family)
MRSASGTRSRIAVFPEPAAIGPVMNLIGLCQGLRELGHECVFVLDPGLAGRAAAYGFEERHLSCMEPMSPEQSAKYWDEFMQRYLPSFRSSAFEQIPTYVKACWEAIAATSEWSVRNGLGALLAELRPDLVVNDNVALYPDTERAGCPWVRMISCSENEIGDPDVPPHLSGCGEADRGGWERFRQRYREVIGPVHERFMDFVASCGHARLPFPEFVAPSPHLNLLLYPKPLRFRRREPLDPRRFVYLDGCVRREAEPWPVPSFGSHDGEPLVYLSFGSLGVADVELMQRMLDVLGRAPYRVLANVGDHLARYGKPPENVLLSSWFPQASVLPHCDVVIQHGGNNTLMETLFHGKAPLVMPFAWDGHDNARRVSDTGHGIGMHRYAWSDAELLGNLERLLCDEAIGKRLRATSAWMQAHDGRRTAAQSIHALLEAGAPHAGRK